MEYYVQNFKLIGIHGKKRSGKDTLFQILNKHVPNVERIAFADELKRHLEILNPIIHFENGRLVHLDEMLNRYGWDRLKELIPEARRLLQVYGTDVIRDNIADSVWVDKCIQKVREINKDNKIAVITDLRFENEYERIKNEGGFLIKIVRPSANNADTHKSESELESSLFDLVIYNDSTLEELEELFKEIFL